MEDLDRRQRLAADTLALWREYKASGDKRLRDKLVMRMAPMVRHIVARKIKSLPPWVDMEDYISCGLEALMRSIERYEPSRGATLEQFAWTRIHGAVLDELRRADWAPRSVRRWQRDSERANDRFTAEHGRRADRRELAQMLGLTEAQVDARQQELYVSEVGSLDAVIQLDDQTAIELVDTIESDDSAIDPSACSTGRAARLALASAIDTLPERDRRVITLKFGEGLTLRQIGSVLGVSESRACQLITAAAAKLRTELADDAELFLDAA
jgi:RNA polymerase sigma factor for flagellar operon FliA